MINIIAICGLKRSGKDTVANIIENTTCFKKTHIATTLKQVCKLLFNFTDDQLNGDTKDSIDERLGITPRSAMQYFGTDIMQYQMDALLPNCGRNFWIDNFIQKHTKNDLLIIADMRFLHEYKALKEKYGNSLLVIKVTNKHAKNDCTHSSEVEWNDIPHDVLIKNDSCMKKLKMKVNLISTVYLYDKLSIK